jgi:hypothetical protein
MQRVRSFSLLLIPLALGLAVACSDDDTTGPNDDPNVDADLAAAIGVATARDAALFTNPGFVTGSIGAGNEFRLNNCTFTQASGRFECPSETVGGLTLTRSYLFTGANGTVLTTFNPANVQGFNVRSHLTGPASLTSASWTGTVDWNGDFSVTGISPTSTSWTWNGTSSSSVTTSKITSGSDTRTYNLQWTTTVANVVVPYPLTAGGYPTSGTITRNVTVNFVGGDNDGESITRTVTVTFNGTQTATLKIGTGTWNLNLATGAVTKI